MPNTIPEVDTYIQNTTPWRLELARLRELVLQSDLQETFKWRTPCYTLNGKNVVIINKFKEYCCLGFFKGVLLKDPQQLLVQQGENTQAVRILRFQSVKDINQYADIIRTYIDEAKSIELAGLKVPLVKKESPLPEELLLAFSENPQLQSAFYALTSGRQRAYILHFSAAKQANTRRARVDRVTPRILEGKGLNDCVCGLSKKMPQCDGSHKQLQTGG